MIIIVLMIQGRHKIATQATYRKLLISIGRSTRKGNKLGMQELRKSKDLVSADALKLV